MAMFSERTAAEAAAYLLFRAGGWMPADRLMPLLYLAERRMLQEHAETLTGDEIIATTNGPALEQIAHFMTDGARRWSPPEHAINRWQTWVAHADNFTLRTARQVQSREDFRRLSDAEVDVLDEVWKQYHAYATSDLVPVVRGLREWADPRSGVCPIGHRAVLEAIGYDAGAVDHLIEERFGEAAWMN